MSVNSPQNALNLVSQKLRNLILDSKISCGQTTILLLRDQIQTAALILRDDAECKFDILLDITAVDYLERKPRFDIVYQFLSVPYKRRLTVKVETNDSVPSLCDLYESANFLEREVFDMFGIRFEGHPDLRRILLYEEFQGWPLRKDYPVRGKQPRVRLRYPEVENTSMDMERVPLADQYVQIARKSGQLSQKF